MNVKLRHVFLIVSPSNALHVSVTEEIQEAKKFGNGKLGKDPTVETSFLPDRSEFCVLLNFDVKSGEPKLPFLLLAWALISGCWLQG